MFKFKKSFLFIVAVLICGVGVLSGAVGVAKADTTAPSTPSITVLSPNGGETWKVGETHRILWASTGFQNVTIDLYDDRIPTSGALVLSIVGYNQLLASQGYYDWTIPQSVLQENDGENFQIIVRDANSHYLVDKSDRPFSIVVPTFNESYNFTAGVFNVSQMNVGWTNPLLSERYIKPYGRVIYRSEIKGNIGAIISRILKNEVYDAPYDRYPYDWYFDNNVKANTNYYYTIKLLSKDGLESNNTEQVVGNIGDSSSFQIFNLRTESIMDNSVIVKWETNKSATSRVWFWLKGGSLIDRIFDLTYKTIHEVKLNVPQQGATYYYVVVSENVSGDKRQSEDIYFTTLTATSTNNKSDLIVTDVGVKYFDNNGNPGNYYYATVKNIGDNLVFNTGGNLGINFKGSIGWLGTSNELVYYFGKQYTGGGNIQNAEEVYVIGPSTNQTRIGTYSIKATVNPNHSIVENNYSNNIFTKTIITGASSTGACIPENEVIAGTIPCCAGLKEYYNPNERNDNNMKRTCRKIEIYLPQPQPTTSDPQITQINTSAGQLHQNKLDEILSELKQLRDKIKEQATELKYLRNLTAGVKDLAQSAKDAINNFITYGVDSNTQKLGAGERAAVINSYKSAFDKLPETEAELTDAIKIANGRFPTITNEKAEKKAKDQFIKIYKRIPDLNDNKDNAAIKVMAYGLRQKAENRNLNSEKVGIKTFNAIYGRTPKTTEDWNAMQAITYSGSAREKDSDGDLLSDKMELQYGTNPNKADTDGDGHKDGAEILDGYNPKGSGNLK